MMLTHLHCSARTVLAPGRQGQPKVAPRVQRIVRQSLHRQRLPCRSWCRHTKPLNEGVSKGTMVAALEQSKKLQAHPLDMRTQPPTIHSIIHTHNAFPTLARMQAQSPYNLHPTLTRPPSPNHIRDRTQVATDRHSKWQRQTKPVRERLQP